MISTKLSFRVLGIALFILPAITFGQANAQQSPKSTTNGANDTTLIYMIASPDVAAKTLATAQEIGKLNGDTYYFISAGMPGIGQVIRVKTTDHTKYMLVGTLNSGKATISNPAEKSAFEQVENNMTVGQARAIGFSGGSDAPQPTPQLASSKQVQHITYEGTAVKKDDGTVEVKLHNGDLVDFLPGAHMLLTSNGSKKVEVTYDGVTSGQTAGKKVENGLSSVAKIGIGGLTRGRAGSIDPQNYTIVEHTPNGELTFDTSSLSDGKPGGGATGGSAGGSPDVAELLGAFDDAVNQNLLQKSYLPARHKLDRVAGNPQ